MVIVEKRQRRDFVRQNAHYRIDSFFETAYS